MKATSKRTRKRSSHSEHSEIATPLAAGAIGAIALTALHETMRHVVRNPPRMDIVGERALAKSMEAMDIDPPRGKNLYASAMVMDVVSNGLFYTLVGRGRRVWMRGAVLGTLAGLGAVLLPPVLGLGKRPVGQTMRTKAMTFAYYLTGGLVAAASSRAMDGRDGSNGRVRR